MKMSILTSNRFYFDYEDMSLNRVEITDVAKGLSNECRFAGQSDFHYSVAQHSVLVSQILERMGADWRAVFGALMHDAAEAFTKDIPTPLKRMLVGYREIEQRVQTYLLDRLAPHANSEHPGIQTADLIALRIEQLQVMRNDDDWEILRNYRDHAYEEVFKIVPMMPVEAYELFLNRYTECLVNSGRNAPQAFLPLGEPR